MVKNLPAMQETWVPSLGPVDPHAGGHLNLCATITEPVF